MSNHTHPLSVLEIHLDRVARNYLYLRKKLQAGADCAAVVKADAYGLGAREVAAALFQQECRHFVVAHFSEGATLRAALPGEALIYALNGPWGAAPEDFAGQGIIPVLNSLGDIEYWAGFAGRSGKRQPCVIHIDTGMRRLGLPPEEVVQLAAKPEWLDALDVRYVMSHLACADEPQHALNAQQLADFRKYTGQLGRAFRYSFANSSGIFLGPDYHFDLARPGCALYGINPVPAENPMHGAVTLQALIVQARTIRKGESAGYGASYIAAKDEKAVTVSIGYADGYLRSGTGRGAVYIEGEKCPVIGRVSMDSIIVSTERLKSQPRPGSYAEIIGPHQTVDEVAAQAGTIGYEILTSLGKRYKRIYTGIET